jgi:RHS repeat-associated protein
VGSVTSALSYNNHGELSTLSYTWPNGGGFQQVLERDSLGRITRITESGISAHVFDYRYDAAGRLDSVAVDNAMRAGYTYDLNGNRVAWRGPMATDTITAGYDTQDRLVRYGNAVYAYTADGELTRRLGGSGDTLRTTYDALGNLTGAHIGTDSLTYLIDGENRRVARVVNGTRTHTWLYQNGLNVIAELDNSGAVVSRYVYATQGHVPDLLVKNGTTYRLITDQLGSVRAVVRVSDGAVMQRTDYDAWGVITYDSSATFQSLGYAGGLMDRSTGLTRFGARDYDPSVGRWTCKDPIYFRAGSMVLYSYVNNDPIDYIDPEGTDGVVRGRDGLIPAGGLPPVQFENAQTLAHQAASSEPLGPRYHNAWEHALGGEYARDMYGKFPAAVLNEGKEYYWDPLHGQTLAESKRDWWNSEQGIAGRHRKPNGQPDSSNLIPDPPARHKKGC